MSLPIIILLSLFLSFIFALGGVGSAIVLVPVLEFLDVDLIQAKVIGLLVTVAATLTAALSNIKNRTLDKALSLPLIVSATTGAIIGTSLSPYVDTALFKWIFTAVLLLSASSMLFYKKECLVQAESRTALWSIGLFSGILSGLLGIGGGLIMVPMLLMVGYDLKRVTASISAVITVSAAAALLGYIQLGALAWGPVLFVTLAGVFGGFAGNYVMHHYLDGAHIKRVLAIFLYLLALKLFITLI